MNSCNLLAIKTHRDKKWTTLNLTCIEDKQLSWKAKAIHTYMISRPPNWQIKSTDLATRSTDGRISLLSGIKELIVLQYIARIVRRDEKRRVAQYGYIAFDIPPTELPELEGDWEYVKHTDKDVKSVDKLQAQNLLTDNYPPIVNNSLNKEQINSEQSFSKEKDISFSQGEKQTNPSTVVIKQEVRHPVLPKNVSRTRTKVDTSFAPIDTTDAEYIIDTLWNEQKLVVHRKGTKNYDLLVSRINALFKGKFVFPKDLGVSAGKKFRRKDFVDSIKEFALAAKHPDYEAPEGSSYKNYLKSMSLANFIYNEHSTNGNKSLFWRFLNNKAKLLSEKYVKDDDPELTEAIMSEYQRQTGTKEEKKAPFIRAAKKLNEFLATNKSKMAAGRTPTIESAAQWLVAAVVKGKQDAPAYYLHGKVVFDEMLPEYCRKENIFKQRNEEKPMRYNNISS